jgi:hypothetical protein
MTLAAIITLAVALAGSIAALVYFGRRALTASDEALRSGRSEIAMERLKDAAVKQRDTALADAVVERKRAEQAVAGLVAATARANRAEEVLRGQIETRLLGSADDVDAVVAELLATDLRDPADAARPAADRGSSAGAAAVRVAARAGSGQAGGV